MIIAFLSAVKPMVELFMESLVVFKEKGRVQPVPPGVFRY
jgi:hypothetical protein